MADNRQEIIRLQKKIDQANREIRDIKKAADIKLSQEIDRMQKEMQYASSRMQSDFNNRLKKIQDTFSEAYLAEIERMKTRYEQLMDQVNSYEAELDSTIHKLEQEQSEFIQSNQKKNQQLKRLAVDSINTLQKNIERACALPVEVFYPRSMQKYIEAGQEAKRLLELELYSLAITKSDCASMSVNRVSEETKNKLDELDALFRIYKLKLDFIDDFLAQDDNRCLIHNDEVVLELNECDIDYWSDLLFSELRQQLDEHRSNVDLGTQGWIHKCDGKPLEPSYLLDKEIQKLELIPEKIGVCISYALSACDCFNYTQELVYKAVHLLDEQNYEFLGIAYGECKSGNNNTSGFHFYYENYLKKEMCVNLGKIPDYREERVLSFKKKHLDASKSDECKIYIVPFRKERTVAYKVFIKLNSVYYPQMIRESLIRLFKENGIELQVADKECSLKTAEQRPLSLQRIAMEGLTHEEPMIENKYCSSY